MSQHKSNDDFTPGLEQPDGLSRRDLLVGSGAALGASPVPRATLFVQDYDPAELSTVFPHSTVVTNDSQRRTLHDVALAVRNDVIAAIGETEDEAVSSY